MSEDCTNLPLLPTCSGKKRKLQDLGPSLSTPNDTESPPKKIKTASSSSNETDSKQMELPQSKKPKNPLLDTFDIKSASESVIRLFGGNAIPQQDPEQGDTHKLVSMNIGSTDWKFEFYQMPTDESNHIYSFLDGLFGDKLCDWKEYINRDHPDNDQLSNNFISIVKDGMGVWRAAILFIVYELKLEEKEEVKYLIKVPLTGVDLHFRRQNVGTVLIQYTVSMIHHIMEHRGDRYEIVVLVIDEETPKSFWTKNKFLLAIDNEQCEYRQIMDRELLVQKGFVRSIEDELIVMMYVGDRTTDLVMKSESVDKFVTPKYTNFNQRYCKRDEIAEAEKIHEEWARKKKELEEKQKQKELEGKGDDESDDDDDESDEDFDVEEAKECMSSDEEDDERHNQCVDGDEDDDEDEDE